MNVKESNLLTNHPSQIDKHVLESFTAVIRPLIQHAGYSSDVEMLNDRLRVDMNEILNIYYLSRLTPLWILFVYSNKQISLWLSPILLTFNSRSLSCKKT